MKSISLNPQCLALVLISLVLISCTFTTTKSKDPVFVSSTDSVAAKIRELILTRNVNVHGTETTTNGKTSSELTIRLINPLNEPNNESQRYQLGKEIAVIIKQAIKNPADYSVYTVLFVKEESNGAVTKSSYRGQKYKLQDL